MVATLIPGAEASEAKPGLAALAGGWQNEDTYWLGGAYYWREVPQGEEEEQLKVKYVLVRVAGGEFSELAVAGAGVFLGEDVDRLKMKMELRGDRVKLYAWTGTAWNGLFDVASGAAGFGDGYRTGLYHDRPAETAAALCRFDEFKLTAWKQGASAAYAYDVNNPYLLAQYTRPDGSYTTYGYDANGDMTSRRHHASGGALQEDWGFEYTEDRYTGKVKLGGVEKRSYEYNGDTYRVRKEVADGATKTFLRDGDSVLAEYDNAGALQKYYFGSAMDRMLAEVEGGSVRWNLAGPQGSVMAVANADGGNCESLPL